MSESRRSTFRRRRRMAAAHIRKRLGRPRRLRSLMARLTFKVDPEVFRWFREAVRALSVAMRRIKLPRPRPPTPRLTQWGRRRQAFRRLFREYQRRIRFRARWLRGRQIIGVDFAAADSYVVTTWRILPDGQIILVQQRRAER